MLLAWAVLVNDATVIVQLVSQLVSMTNYRFLPPTEQGILLKEINVNILNTPCMDLFTVHCTGVAFR